MSRIQHWNLQEKIGKKWLSRITGFQKTLGSVSGQLKKVLVPYAMSLVPYQP